MSRLSAGIALIRRVTAGDPNSEFELLAVHPGGPYWQDKDTHAWSIPKGELDGVECGVGERAGPDAETTARREFAEETGHPVPAGPLVALPPLALGSGKWLHAFVLEGEIDADRVVSNDFELEWPPRSGRMQRFPEVDGAAWFDFDTARTKLHKGQVKLVDLLEQALRQGALSPG